jgi:hypothetical protein
MCAHAGSLFYTVLRENCLFLFHTPCKWLVGSLL